MRALHSRKREISMNHRAKDMSENIFCWILGHPAPQFLTNSKKTCYVYSNNRMHNIIVKTRSF